MKKKEFKKELQNKKRKELIVDLVEYRKKLQDLRFNLSTKKLKNFHEIDQVKKKIAQILTILNQKEEEITGEEQFNQSAKEKE